MSDTVSIKMNDDCPTGHNCLFSEKLFELSDEITRLRAENERLRETLNPFVKAIKGQIADILFGDMPDKSTATVMLQLGDLRRARTTLKGETK